MNFERSFLRQHGLTVAFAALLATACGGTFSGAGGSGASGPTAGTGGSGAGGPTAGAGGSAAGAGGGVVCDVACPLIQCNGTPVYNPGQCCPSCEPNGGAGGLSSGGSGGCLDVGCVAIGCGPGFISVLQPGACCPSCVPDGSGGGCGDVACPAIACASGYTLQQNAGSCCPTCVPSNDCELGQQSYNTLRQQLLAQPGAVACKVNNDCTLLDGNAYCGDVCSGTPVNAAAAQSINNELQAYATNNCSTCTPVYPPCALPSQPACIEGQCIIGGFTTQ